MPHNGSRAAPAADNAAAREKDAGNLAYKAKRFEDAMMHYSRAIELSDGQGPVAAASFLNRAVARLDLLRASSVVIGQEIGGNTDTFQTTDHKEGMLVVADCDAALEIQPSYTKALLKRGDAFMAMGEPALAMLSYQCCQAPKDVGTAQQLRSSLAAAERRIAQYGASQTDTPSSNGRASAEQRAVLAGYVGVGITGVSDANRPGPQQQRWDIARLLAQYAERGACVGDTYALVPWVWWQQWCAYVGGCSPASDVAPVQRVLRRYGTLDLERDDARVLRELSPWPLAPEKSVPPPPLSTLGLLDLEDMVAETTHHQRSAAGGAPGTGVQGHQHADGHPPLLKRGVRRGRDYEVVGEEAFSALSHWWGLQGPPLIRRVIPLPPQGSHATAPLCPCHQMPPQGTDARDGAGSSSSSGEGGRPADGAVGPRERGEGSHGSQLWVPLCDTSPSADGVAAAEAASTALLLYPKLQRQIWAARASREAEALLPQPSLPQQQQQQQGELPEAAAARQASVAPAVPAGAAATVCAPCCTVCGEPAPLFCSRCKVARYCSERCQRSHWPSHKDGRCKALTASSAASSGSAASSPPPSSTADAAADAFPVGSGAAGSAGLDGGEGANASGTAIALNGHKAAPPGPSAPNAAGSSAAAASPAGLNGLVGLVNVGNTCFMASALQALSATFPLTSYFLSERWREDWNTDNPDGSKGGLLALAFDQLLRALWFAKDARPVVPSDMKRALARFNHAFGGFAQHDAQELLLYLLDGLHEDLNRVKRKANTVNADEDGSRPDAEAAADAWARHLVRNKSVIVDLFYGLQKSTLVCPDPACRRVSVRFEPFNMLQLPLPSLSARHFNVKLQRTAYDTSGRAPAASRWAVPPLRALLGNGPEAERLRDGCYPAAGVEMDWRGTHASVGGEKPRPAARWEGFGLTLPSSASFAALRAAVAEQTGIPGHRLALFTMGSVPATLGHPAAQRTLRRAGSEVSMLDLQRAEDEEKESPDICVGLAFTGPRGAADGDAVSRMQFTLYAYEVGNSHAAVNSPAEGPAADPAGTTAPEGPAAPRSSPDSSAPSPLRFYVEHMTPKLVSSSAAAADGAPDSGAPWALVDEESELDVLALEAAQVVAQSWTLGAPGLVELPRHATVAQLRLALARLCAPLLTSWAAWKLQVAESLLQARAEGFLAGLAGQPQDAQPPFTQSQLHALNTALLRAESSGDFSGLAGFLPPGATSDAVALLFLAHNLPVVVLGGWEDERGPRACSWLPPMGPALFGGDGGGEPSQPPQRLDHPGVLGDLLGPADATAARLQQGPALRLGIAWRSAAWTRFLDLGRFESTQHAPQFRPWLQGVFSARSRVTSLPALLTQWSLPDVLDAQNTWYCSDCRTHVRASQTLQVWAMPPVLVVHLKRFKARNSVFSEKLDMLVDFPLVGLDVSAACAPGAPALSGKGGSGAAAPVYDLYALVNHMGTASFGHYTAYANHAVARHGAANGPGKWFCFDDSFVTEVPASEVVSPAAYVLFYRRRE